MKTIPLTQGKVAFVDDRFYKRLVQMGPWHAINDRTWYARNGKHVLMYRIIMQLATGECPRRIDHKNQNSLDNQLANLRPATKAQNAHNTKCPRSNTSRFKGVCKHKQSHKWQAQLTVNLRNTYLGTFATRQDAARAYNEAARKYFGEFAWLNRIEQRRKQIIPVAVKRRSGIERRVQC